MRAEEDKEEKTTTPILPASQKSPVWQA